MYRVTTGLGRRGPDRGPRRVDVEAERRLRVDAARGRRGVERRAVRCVARQEAPDKVPDLVVAEAEERGHELGRFITITWTGLRGLLKGNRPPP